MIAAGPGFPAASGINVFENRSKIYVHELSQVEEALEKSGKMLPAHVRILRDGKCQLDLDIGRQGTITGVNPVILATYGYAPFSKTGDATQNQETQLHILQEYGIREERIFADEMTGSSMLAYLE